MYVLTYVQVVPELVKVKKNAYTYTEMSSDDPVL